MPAMEIHLRGLCSLTVVVARAGAAAVAVAALGGGCRDVPPPPPPAPMPALLIPPLHDAEPGEELRMRRGYEEWIWRVASATDEEIEIDCRKTLNGTPIGTPETQRWSRNGFGLPKGCVIREVRRDRIEVAGKEWTCWLIRAVSRENGAFWYWISEELPVSGFLRIAKDERGKPQLGAATEAMPDASSFSR